MAQTFERNGEIEATELNDEAILFDPKSTQFFMLNSTSAFIWAQLERPLTVQDLGTAIANKFSEVEVDAATADAGQAVEDMLSKELIVTATG